MDNGATQGAVSAAVWPWREADDGPVVEDVGTRRKRAAIESAVTYGVAAVFLAFGKHIVASVVCTVATIVLLGGLFVPPVYHGFKRGGMWLAKVVGVGLSWVLLVPFFYICFGIGRVILLVSGKDPLNRRFPTDEPSYWLKRAGRRPPESYLKQY